MKLFKHYLLVLAISSLPFLSIFASPLFLHTHDGPMHIARIPEYLRALTSLHIPPRWAATLNFGYGMPLFNFYYHIPYLIGAFLFASGLSLTMTFKISLFVAYLLSGVTFFLFSDYVFGDKRRAWIATLLYQFAPFHLVDIVVRGDVGEALAMGFFPLLLYFLSHIENTSSKKWTAWAGICTALLITSHSAVSLMYVSLAILWIILTKKRSQYVPSFAALVLGLGIAAFYWIPVLFERKYTYGDFFMKDMYTHHFPPLIHFFVPNVTNTPSLQTGGVDISLGIGHTVAFLLGIFAFFSKKKHPYRSIIIFSLLGTVVALFLMSQAAGFLWSGISILRAFQFPWRFLVIPLATLSILGGAVLIPKHRSLLPIILLSIVIIASTAVYWRPPLGFDRIDERSYINYQLDTTYFGETNLVWSAGHMSSKAPTQFSIISGEGTITDSSSSWTTHTATIHAKTDVRILDATQYYPGWRVYEGSKKIPVEFQDQNHRGLVTFTLPKGSHSVRVSFGETPLRLASDVISIAGSLIAMFLIII